MIRLTSVLLILLASAAQAAEPAGREQTAETDGIIPPEPLGNPGDWVTSDDYPPGALREDIEGVTRFELTIGSNGRVTGCKVTTSSGSDDLDQATCALISQRAMFSPAHDAEGAPVQGTWSSAVRWMVPSETSLPQPSLFVVSYVADVDGTVSDCTVERAEGFNELAMDSLEQLCPAELSEPSTDDEGNPVKRRVRMTQSVAIEPI